MAEASLNATGTSVDSVLSACGKKQPHVWKGETASHIDKAGLSQSMSRRGHHDSMNEIRVASANQHTNQRQVMDALKFQSTKTKHLMSDIQSTLNATGDNIKKLEQEKAKLELLLKSKTFMLDDTNKWLAYRAERPARELVDDAVQQRLIALLKQLQLSISKLTIEGVNEVVKALEAGNKYKNLLLADLEDKKQHYGLDVKCLEELSEEAMGGPKMAELMKNAKHMERDWETKSVILIKEAKDHCPFSTTLRASISALSCHLEACESSRTNELRLALCAKIKETTDLKANLTKQISVQEAEVAKTQKTIVDLTKAIDDKQKPLALAEERYETRKQRPERELVDDKPERQLATEVKTLKDILDKLTKQKAGMEAKLKQLQDDIAQLQADKADKTKSLQIDKKVDTAMVTEGEYDVIKTGKGDWKRLPTAKGEYLEKTRGSRTQYPNFMLDENNAPKSPGSPLPRSP
ncbi:hypothetical protein CYMTET_34085 [Cymbomonas tetramitiformis]|uniref:Uncharacterized protein n=1 Tax=Cymbomonas tetramitiformis TaxID=36881 RepID=A0AAE0FBW1_9CHLO|nr:hypothetical protein CYMTET_34085 [Cymbomonas tetramitiformis]